MAGFAHPEYLVDGDYVQSRLNDPGVRIFDADTLDAFNRAHIPGAVAYRDARFKNPNDPRFVMTPAQFAEAVASAGIGNDTEVIAYDAAGSVNAGRVWWTLRFFGHRNVKVLDGGWNTWLKQGRSVTMARTRVEHAAYRPRVDESQRADAGYIMAALDRPDVVVLDVRSDGEWDGTNNRGNKRAGHIPGAVHLEWLNSVGSDDERCFKSPAELRQMFEAIGVTPEKEIITV